MAFYFYWLILFVIFSTTKNSWCVTVCHLKICCYYFVLFFWFQTNFFFNFQMVNVNIKLFKNYFRFVFDICFYYDQNNNNWWMISFFILLIKFFFRFDVRTRKFKFCDIIPIQKDYLTSYWNCVSSLFFETCTYIHSCNL